MSVKRRIANVILDGTVTWKQVKTYFLTHAWAKYKACRELIKHTGGGDGDQGRHNPGSDAEDENVSEEETKKLRAKRKKEGKSNWSDETLQKFMKSKIYKMIDKVAHDDSSVIPPRVFGSTEDISDDDTTDDTPKQAKKRHHGESSPDASTQGLMEAVRSITKKSKTQEQIALANLEIARRREEREQLEREERLALLKRREEREEQELADRREAIRREIRAAEEAKRDKQWEQAMIMLDSPHEAIQNEEKRRIAELNAQTAAK
ncbi:hypothetical protein C8J56DRAFT_884474 [Mycena floridula]|nr:hypothetical protein C8J56DRAFT_884474 [Mycena floridula]